MFVGTNRANRTTRRKRRSWVQGNFGVLIEPVHNCFSTVLGRCPPNTALHESLTQLIAPKRNSNNTYATFWGDKQRALWYVMVFSGLVS